MVGGSVFLKSIEALQRDQQEEAIVRQVTGGNIPSFLRPSKAIRVTAKDAGGTEHHGIYYVMPDYLAVGSDEDFVRIPLTPLPAQKIADQLGCVLTTRKMADDIYRAAEVKLEPRPMTERREDVATFYEHHKIIEAQRVASGKAAGALVAGIKKDVVVSNRLKERPGRVAIYGWHKLDGTPIQPLTIVHGSEYVDYSHGVRLMGRAVVADGTVRDAREVLKSGALNGLLSDEGPLEVGER